MGQLWNRWTFGMLQLVCIINQQICHQIFHIWIVLGPCSDSFHLLTLPLLSQPWLTEWNIWHFPVFMPKKSKPIWLRLFKFKYTVPYSVCVVSTFGDSLFSRSQWDQNMYSLRFTGCVRNKSKCDERFYVWLKVVFLLYQLWWHWHYFQGIGAVEKVTLYSLQ